MSPALYGLHAALEPQLARLASGRVLDTGCGTMPFRPRLPPAVTAYVGLDIEARSPDLTYVADLQGMPEVPSNDFDTAICSEVLEHIPAPELALAELHRVLRPGGRLFLSVPFLSRLHEEPHDYYRYTTHGLRVLLERHGFEVEKITSTGSVFSFLGHQVSTALVVSTHGIPVVGRLVFLLNAVAVVLPCRLLDRLPGLRRKLPLGYVAVARKRAQREPE